MMGHDLVRPDAERHGALRMTHAARPILRGEASIDLRRDALQARDRPAVKTLVDDEDAPLLSALKAQRRALAEAQSVPAYVIFPDRTLIEMAERKPQTMDDMAGISGIGAVKLERYGATFLKVITGADAGEMHPARRKLAGRTAGTTFDRLQDVQARLSRGADGTGKPLSCNAATLRWIAERKPSTLDDLSRAPGITGPKLDRFGDAFLAVLYEG